MKKIIKINILLSLFYGIIIAQAPLAPGTEYPTTIKYLGTGQYGASNTLSSASGQVNASIIIGQQVVEDLLEGSQYNASLGFYSYLLNVPDAPIVEAGDAESGGGITVSWKMDINSPVADATATFPLAAENTNGGQINEDKWLLTRKSLSNPGTEATYFTPQNFGSFIVTDNDPAPNIGDFYEYGVTTSNQFGHSKEGTDIGFRTPNGKYQGHVYVISATPSYPHDTQNPGPPVPGVEVTLTPISGEPEGTAVELDGTGDRMWVETNYSTWFDGENDPLTFEAWFNIDPDHNTQPFLVDMGANGLGVYFGSSSLITSYRGGTTYHTKPAAANDDGTTGWYHLAVVYDGSTLKSSLYKKLDGSLDEQSASATGTTAFAEGQLIFGEQAGVLTDADNLKGVLDEIRLWTTAKDSLRLARNRGRSLQRTDSGNHRVANLLAYWKMDEGVGGNAYDMADLDDGQSDGKEVLQFDGDADWSTEHSGVKLSAYTDGTGEFVIDDIPYNPGATTYYIPAVELVNHDDLRPSPAEQVGFSENEPMRLNQFFWDHSLFEVSGNIKYAETLYNLDSVEIMIQYGRMEDANGDGVPDWVAGDNNWADQTSDRYTGTITKFAPRTYTSAEGNYAVNLEPGSSVRLFAYHGGRWEQTEPYTDNVYPFDGVYGLEDTFNDLDEDGVRDVCLDENGAELGGAECYLDGDVFENTNSSATMPYWEYRNISEPVAEQNFVNTHLDTVSLFVGGGECGFSIGNFEVYVNTSSQFASTSAYRATKDYDDNGETLASRYDILVPPVPLYFKPVHTIQNVNDNLTQDPSGSFIQYLDLSDGPNGDYETDYALDWVYRNPALTIDRGDLYTVSDDALDLWSGQSGDDGQAGTDDDVALSTSWGLSSVVDSDANVTLFEQPYEDEETFYVKQGDYDADDVNPDYQYNRDEITIFTQGDRVFTEFLVYADYTGLPTGQNEPRKCGCDDFTFTAADNITGNSMQNSGTFDRAGDYEVGRVFYQLTAVVVNTGGDHLRNFNYAVQDEYGRQGSGQMKAYVLGLNEPSAVAGYLSVDTETNQIPFFILRDPPGDQSFAYIEEGETICQEYSWSVSSTQESENSIAVSLGLDLEFETGVSFGAHFALTTSLDFTLDNTGSIALTDYASSTESHVLCLTANETFSTSDVESHSPLLSDLYVGSAMVINSGLASRLHVDASNSDGQCEGAPCMKIKQEMIAGPDGFPSKFLYSEWFIVNSLLPEIYYNIQYYNTGGTQDPLHSVLWWDESRRDEIWFLYGPDDDDSYDQPGYLIPPQSLPVSAGDYPHADSLQIMVDLYNHWVSYVQRNQTLKADATDITDQVYVYPTASAEAFDVSLEDVAVGALLDDPVAEGALPSDWGSGDAFGTPDINLENISISGGNSYLYEFENNSEATSTTDFTFAQHAQWDFAAGATFSGLGAVYGHMESSNKEYTTSESITQGSNRTVGIFFKDDDILDNFNVHIKMDDTCMPVYEVESGRSSNPWEPTTSTQKIDLAEVTMYSGTGEVGTPENGGPGADSTVVFNLQLLNVSETSYDRTYVLSLDNASNPGGAMISGGDGAIQGGGYAVTLAHNEAVPLALGVSRGLADYFYPDLAFTLASPFEMDVAGTWNQYDYPTGNIIIPGPQNASTQFLSVYYNPPCQTLGLVVNQSAQAPAHDNEDLDFVVNKVVQDTFRYGLPMIISGYNLDDENLVSMELQWLSVGGLDEGDESLWQQSEGTAFVLKGDWTAGIAYLPGDVILFDEQYYRCLQNQGHTSGTNFSVDENTRWEPMFYGDNQYSAQWTYPPDGDGLYFVRSKSVCDIADQVSYSPIMQILVDTKGPRIHAIAPMDGVLGSDDIISFAFDEFISCGDADNWSRLVDLDNHNLAGLPTTIPSTATCFENEVIVNINTSVTNAMIENHRLEARLGGDGLSPVTDLYGNNQEDPDGEELETVSFGFVVDRNPIHWSVANLNEQIFNEIENVFTIELTNNGTEVMTFEIGDDWEVPWWIVPTPDFGTINPGGAMDIELDIDPNLPIGLESGVVYAETLEGDEPLIVVVTVLCPSPLHWDVNVTAYQYMMNVVTNVQFMGNSTTDMNDKLVAIIDGEVRGVADIGNTLLTGTGNRTSITVYSNDNSSGDTAQQVSFRLWDSDQCSERWEGFITSLGGGFPGQASISFESLSVEGTVMAPVTINFTNAIARTIDVSQGYTQVSFNLNNSNDMSLDHFLMHIDKMENDQVIGSSGFATWMGGHWESSVLTEINPLETYILYLQAPDQEMYYVGNYVDPETPISLDEGWTWFSYLPNGPQPMNTTVFNLVPEPSTGDIVRNQYGFASYTSAADLQLSDSLGLWLGTLDFLMPGQGFQSHLAQTTTLTFGEQNSMGRMMSGSSHLVDVMRLYDELEFNPHLYEHTMNIIAVVESDTFGLNDPDDQVIVYDADGIIRGISQPVYIAALDQHRLFMTVYANEVYGEELSMRFYDSSEDVWYYCRDHILFAANGITGSIHDPMMISLSPLSIGDRGYIPDTYVLSQNYPNPFNPVTSLGFGVPEPAHVTVMIYNVLGQEVRELFRGHMQPGYQFMQWDGKDMYGTPGPSGMYIVVMQAGEFIDTKKVILLK
jgi:hypothetical protein